MIEINLENSILKIATQDPQVAEYLHLHLLQYCYGSLASLSVRNPADCSLK